jgi:hypothetical protein
MRPIWYLVVVASLASFAFATSGKITGILVDEDGAPVPHMSVEACPADVGFSGILPSAMTDQQGKFVIKVRISNEPERWNVYPYDEETGYYPRPGYGFYVERETYSKTVELSPKIPEASVELTLGPKAGALSVHVVDATTGAGVAAEFNFAWASEPDKQRSIRYYYGREDFRILLPANTDLTLNVTAQGCKPWSYPGVINVGPGQDLPLDVQLEPETADSPSGPSESN